MAGWLGWVSPSDSWGESATMFCDKITELRLSPLPDISVSGAVSTSCRSLWPEKVIPGEIQTERFNPWLYNYCWFRKTDGHHIDILFPISILTYLSSLAHQISSKSINTRRSYDVMSVFKDSDHRVKNLLPDSHLITALVWEHWNLYAF